MAAQVYGHYEDRTLQQRSSNWSYVYKVDEHGRVDPPVLTATYYPSPPPLPSYNTTNVNSYHGTLPLQRTKITRIEAVVRNVTAQNPSPKPSRRQQGDDFASKLQEEVMKIIAQRGGDYAVGEYDDRRLHVVPRTGQNGGKGHDSAANGRQRGSVGNRGGYDEHRDNEHRTRRGPNEEKTEEAHHRFAEVNGDQDRYHHQGSFGWYPSSNRAKEDENRGSQRRYPRGPNHQEEDYGGNRSYPPHQDQSRMDRKTTGGYGVPFRQDQEGYWMSPNANQQRYYHAAEPYPRHSSGVDYETADDHDGQRYEDNSSSWWWNNKPRKDEQKHGIYREHGHAGYSSVVFYHEY